MYSRGRRCHRLAREQWRRDSGRHDHIQCAGRRPKLIVAERPGGASAQQAPVSAALIREQFEQHLSGAFSEHFPTDV